MRRSVTENYYDNCPNCGAVIQPDYKVCPYCGTTTIKSRTVSEEDGISQINNIATQNVYYMNDDREENRDTRKVDIVSDIEPSNESTASTIGTVLFMVIWIGVTVFMTFGFAEAGAGGAALIPFGMGVCGLFAMASSIMKKTKAGTIRDFGQHYSAKVLGHSKTVEKRGSGDSLNIDVICAVKVLADIDGREQCILVKTSNDHADVAYPVGCTITIAGSGHSFVIVE